VELVPKIGVGIMCGYGNERSLLYHIDKNGVKVGKQGKGV